MLFRSDAIGLLKKKGIEINLVCTGNIVDYRNEGYANDILNMLTENKIRNQVYLLGLIPRADQLSIFRISTAMIQPSVNEGWSTSVEEAKALGKTILTSDIEVHREQIPDNPFEFKSFDAQDLASKLEKLYFESASREFPDVVTEKQALSQYRNNIQKFGERFLEIAKS